MRKLTNHTVGRYIVFALALVLIAVSINMFYAPHDVAAGGATGLAVLAEVAFGWPVALTTLGVNVLMLIAAVVFLDKATTGRILLGSFALPLMLALIPQYRVVSDPLLAVIVGSAIFAVGVALLYRIDASSGGTTVPPLIFKKYFGLKPAIGLLAVDLLVSLGNIVVSGLEPFILAVFSIVLTSIVMNYIETGLDRKKTVFVMSNTALPAIKQVVNEQLPHGLTVVPVTGGFSDQHKEMLMIVVEQADYQGLTRQILAMDPDAFITVADVAAVHNGIF
ncbi:YitT family protein [Schleiferilactobacillus shenzhenensis]|uniref:DUF2179 domain-containing protein n=1 Tax=Schleiferilactobacillus shenzhenensis LY-73 TaxID=1231336 RepID=U4TNG1_9LACO|nr:YitT family protein [Schleiferilactobacillus shenzhenensis]ERL65759.1 hypothetical protein L248_2445 [Schleiferilactobacillus shenzhenensis LY-73]